MIAIRGATTVLEDTREQILSETKIMLEKIISENNINIEDIISIIFTATKDIKSVYPAVSAREMGIVNASLICMQEMDVTGSLQKCIRVHMEVESDKRQKDANHVYLNGAEVLRPDLKRN